MSADVYNMPFYFGLRRPSRLGDVGRAAEHIAAEFGVTGRTEVVRVEPGWVLCRVVTA